MLKTLSLKNLVLVEEANIDFHSGLTVITGETGAGKTALIEAIRLILGERADASKVRKGAEKAQIQAAFELNCSQELSALFDEAGLNLDFDEPLLVTREIAATGKSRAFVSGQMVPLAFLGKIAPYLVDFIGQHAQVMLKNEANQRDLLDLYAGVELKTFQTLWENEKQLAKELEKLKTKGSVEILEAQLKELEDLGLEKGEEEKLFEEFSLLSNSKEILEMSALVQEESDQALALCGMIKSHLDKVPLAEVKEMAKEAHLQLSEMQRSLQSFMGKMEADPGRLEFLDARLSLIEKLKRKYGKDLIGAKAKLRAEFDELAQIEEKESELALSRKKTAEEATKISQKRKSGAKQLAEFLSNALQELNIPTAEVQILIEATPRSFAGEDRVTFMLRANKGEKIAPVKDCSSSGELSRLLFSIKIALSGKQPSATLIFDEIDANVGGNTATLLGEKLAELGKNSQVLCITHFAQVARFGQQHVRVYKKEHADRTIGMIESLEEQGRKAEFSRMIGG